MPDFSGARNPWVLGGFCFGSRVVVPLSGVPASVCALCLSESSTTDSPSRRSRAVGRETAQTAGNSHFFDMVIGRRCFFSVLGGAWMMSGGAVPIFSGIMRRLRRAEAQRFPDFLSHALPQLDVGSGGWDVLSRFRPACPPRGSGRRLAMRPPDNLTKRDKEGDRGRGMNFWYNWLYFVRAPAFSKIQPGRR